MTTRSNHPVVLTFALAFYVCCLTWNAWAGSNVKFGTLIVDDTVITRSPLVDVRAFMDGQSGRPTLATWEADQANTDATTAIQAAIDSLPTNTSNRGVISPKGYANGGTVLIPRGRYKVTSTINLKRGIRIVGVGREASQIVSYTPGSVFQYLDAGRYVPDEIVFENLSIWQDRKVVATSGAGIEINTGTSNSGTAFKGENLHIEGTYYGLFFQGIIASKLAYSQTSKTVSHGIYISKRAGPGGLETASTSTVFESVYANQSVTGDGFRFEGGGYLACIACASDSNFRYGYSVQGGGTVYLNGGAEYNGTSDVYVNNSEATTITLVIYSGPGGSHGITLDNAYNAVISGSTIGASVLNTSGYGIHNNTPRPLIVTASSFVGPFATKVIDNSAYALFLNHGGGGLYGGLTNSWALGATGAPDNAVQLKISGTADKTVGIGLWTEPTFTAPNASYNAAYYSRGTTADSAQTYPLVAGQYIADAFKGTSSTIKRTAGIIVEDQTQGNTANAALMIGGIIRTIPSGNWSIYSSSEKDSVFVGKLRLGSATGPTVSSGAGSPNNVMTAPVGSLFLRTDGAEGSTLYIKESGTGKSGWVAK